MGKNSSSAAGIAVYREGFALSMADAGTGSGVVCASSLLATRSTERLYTSKEYKSELPVGPIGQCKPDQICTGST